MVYGMVYGMGRRNGRTEWADRMGGPNGLQTPSQKDLLSVHHSVIHSVIRRQADRLLHDVRAGEVLALECRVALVEDAPLRSTRPPSSGLWCTRIRPSASRRTPQSVYFWMMRWMCGLKPANISLPRSRARSRNWAIRSSFERPVHSGAHEGDDRKGCFSTGGFTTEYATGGAHHGT